MGGSHCTLRRRGGGRVVQQASTLSAELSSVPGSGSLSSTEQAADGLAYTDNMEVMPSNLGPIAEDGPADSKGPPMPIQTLQQKDPRALLDEMFLPVPQSVRAAPAPPPLKKGGHNN
jgi:hypothetical protein